MESEYTSYGLPKVTSKTIHDLKKRFGYGNKDENMDYGAFLESVRIDLRIENPELLVHLEDIISGYCPALREPILQVTLGLYGVLVEQESENKFNGEKL